MRRRNHQAIRVLLGIVAIAMVAAGCGTSDVDSAAAFDAEGQALEGAGGTERFAVLTATWLRGQRGTVRRTEPLSVRGLFVSHAGLDREDVLRVLGVPQLLKLPAVDTCVVDRGGLSPALRDAPEDGELWVDLLDAGQVALHVGDEAATLDYQYFPDVVSFVSGVTYAGSAQLARWAMRRVRRPVVRFSGSGSDEVGAFSVVKEMPPPLRLYAVGGRRARQGYVSVKGEGDLEVRWDRREGAEEPVLVEYSRRSFGAVDTIRCVVQDDGAFIIPSEHRAELPRHDEPATDRLSVRRAVGSEFYARGIDEGWALLITEDFVLLR